MQGIHICLCVRADACGILAAFYSFSSHWFRSEYLSLGADCMFIIILNNSFLNNWFNYIDRQEDFLFSLFLVFRVFISDGNEKTVHIAELCVTRWCWSHTTAHHRGSLPAIISVFMWLCVCVREFGAYFKIVATERTHSKEFINLFSFHLPYFF